MVNDFSKRLEKSVRFISKLESDVEEEGRVPNPNLFGLCGIAG